jgi:hypothetical protein
MAVWPWQAHCLVGLRGMVLAHSSTCHVGLYVMHAEKGCGKTYSANHPKFMQLLDGHPMIQDLYPIVGHMGEAISTEGLLISRRLYDLMYIQTAGASTVSEFARDIEELHHRHYYKQWKLWLLSSAKGPTQPSNTQQSSKGTMEHFLRKRDSNTTTGHDGVTRAEIADGSTGE